MNRMLTVTYPAEPNTVGQVWSYRVWQPTTDTTIWTALMGIKDEHGGRMSLFDSKRQNGSWLADYLRGESCEGNTQGEAVCACFVAADPLGHLGRAGV